MQVCLGDDALHALEMCVLVHSPQASPRCTCEWAKHPC